MRHLRTILLLLICIHLLAGVSFAALKTDVKAPDFTLKTVDGEEVSLSDFAGQVVILHFWKSNWRQCHAEIPHLKKIAAAYDESQVKILSLNAINPEGQAKAEAQRYGIEFPVLVCRKTGVVKDYKITKLPHLFIIDHEGVIRESKLFLKTKKIKAVLDQLVQELPVPETAEE